LPIASGCRPRAISIRFIEPNRFITSGNAASFTRSKITAGPFSRTSRCAISATS
jgi:hypothetical protein